MSQSDRYRSRRTFLRRAGLIAASSLVLPACGVLLAPDLHSVAGEMTRLLRRREQARAMGRAFLEGRGMLETASVEAIARRLLDRMQLDLDGMMYLSVSDLRQTLAGCIREDFAAEDVAVVEGWLLSVTEAYLCALSYVHEQRA